MQHNHNDRRDPAEILSRLSHLNVTGKISKQDAVLKSGGGSSDVYQSRWLSTGGFVAVRQLRSHLYGTEDHVDLKKSIALELRIWSDLKHPNVLPLLGYTYDFGENPACVTEWMFNGTVTQYLNRNPDADRLEMIRGIATGLEYLHRKEVVHSDIKAENIVVSPEGVPMLLDFGLSRLLVISRVIKTARDLGGTFRWMAIELLTDVSDIADDNDEPPQIATKSSDVWAFGMTVLEIMTDKVPYAEVKRDFQVVPVIASGKLPSKPIARRSIDESLWVLCNKCWALDPTLRPSMTEILKDIRGETSSDIMHIDLPPSAVQLHPLLGGEASQLELAFDLSAASLRLFMRTLLSPQIRLEPVHPDHLAQVATIPPMTRMCIKCAELGPYSDTPEWTITIVRRNPINIGAIIVAIHAMLRTQITHAEWAGLEEADSSKVQRAYNRRCRAFQNANEREHGVRRVDFLREKVLFAGLIKRADNDNFELLVKARS